MNTVQTIEDKAFLLAGNLRQFLAEDNEAVIINDIVDAMDLNILYRKASLQSNAICHPAIMLKILIHAYTMGIFSSRRIQRALKESVSFIYLATWQKPNFHEIKDFRKNNILELQILLVHFAEICRHLQLVSCGNLIFDDGQAQAGEPNRLDFDQNKIKQQAEALLKKADLVDSLEDAIFGDQSEQRIPDEVRNQKDRMRKLQEIMSSIRNSQIESI